MNGKSITVEARFSPDGEITPQRFDWQGRLVAVHGVGRRWTDQNERCFNVMALGNRTFELRLDTQSLRWSIARGPIPGMLV